MINLNIKLTEIISNPRDAVKKTDSSQVLLQGKGHLGQTWDVMPQAQSWKQRESSKAAVNISQKNSRLGIQNCVLLTLMLNLCLPLRWR